MKKQAVLIPGDVLKEKYMDAYQISVATISKDIGLSPSAIRQLINNKLKISIKIAWKLSKYFDTPIEEWINLQNKYELAELGGDVEFMESIKSIPKAKKAESAPAKPARNARAAKGDKPAGRRGASRTPRDQSAGAGGAEKRTRRPRAAKPVAVME